VTPEEKSSVFFLIRMR